MPCSSPHLTLRRRPHLWRKEARRARARPPSCRWSPTSCGPRPCLPSSGFSPGSTTGIIFDRNPLRSAAGPRLPRATPAFDWTTCGPGEAVDTTPACAPNGLTAELQPLPGRRPAAVRRGEPDLGAGPTGCGRGRDTVYRMRPSPGPRRRPARHPAAALAAATHPGPRPMSNIAELAGIQSS